uniref:Strictosidine synthase-like 10-like protein n=1 Tax=Oliveria decumbens TaxID=2571315 RepID=A0A6B9Q4U2_9APIA|nr:strictosidine synthase-like 10-like protein [Oliveria decumbens]
MKSRKLPAAVCVFFVLTVISSVVFGSSFLSHRTLKDKSTESPDYNDGTHQYEVMPIFNATGPESFAFDVTGEGPYTGVSDGRIIKWNQSQRRWTSFSVTTPDRNGCEGPHDHTATEDVCGRPLGLCCNKKTGDLYIADAYMGLHVVGPNGGLATKLTSEAEGVPFKFTNGVDIDDTNGDVYFTDSSSVYSRRNHTLVTLTGDNTGRLLKYNIHNKETTVILKNLYFPNGVALSKNKDFLIFAETSACRVLRLWLQPSEKAGKLEVFSELPGYPDNIKMNDKGEFWVALWSRRLPDFSAWLSSNIRIRNAVRMLTYKVTKLLLYTSKFKGSGVAVKLSENGEIIQIFEDRLGKVWKYASEVYERDGYLSIGSVVMPYAVAIKK